MDFEGGSWDVAADAENLHQSLFGNLSANMYSHDSRKLKKGKKRKHSTVSDNTEHKKFRGNSEKQTGDSDKLTSDSDKQALKAKHKKKIEKPKPKATTLKHANEENQIGNGGSEERAALPYFVHEDMFSPKERKDGEGSPGTNAKKEKIHVKTAELHESSDGSNRKDGKDSADHAIHFENAVKKKKKRKRKCKKNKFKDYSKPDSSVKDEDNFDKNNGLKLGTESKVTSFNETETYTSNTKGVIKNADSPDTSVSKHKKKKRKKMKTEKDLDFDPSTVGNSREEIFMKVTSFSNGSELSMKQKNKHKWKNEELASVSLKDIGDIVHSDDQQLIKKGSDISLDKKSSALELESKIKIKHKLKGEKVSSLKATTFSEIVGNNNNTNQQNKKSYSIDKKDFAKHKRNQLDPEKLQAILKNKVQINTGSDDSNVISKGNNIENDKLKTKRETYAAPESLLEKSRRRLNAARFRYLNEQLYTTTGSEAFQMFRKDKEAFEVYHDGFQGQVEKWPVNPVDLIIDSIKSKSKNLVVADFGCGDAKLAQNVPNKVHSFDLVALNQHVTVCDMSKVPLKDSSVDVAIFCLSLMGTNLSSYLLEANRVLKKNGILKIAEVASRFQSTGRFVLEVEKMGFKTVNQDNSNKMFVMMDFKKTKAANLPAADITLDPCIYKKR